MFLPQLAVSSLTVAVWTLTAWLIAPGQWAVLGESVCCGIALGTCYCMCRASWRKTRCG